MQVYPITCALLLVGEVPLAIRITLYQRQSYHDNCLLISLHNLPVSLNYDRVTEFFQEVLLNIDLELLISLLPVNRLFEWTVLLALLKVK